MAARYPDWNGVEGEFHREWGTRYAPLGLSWEEAKPAYRFGWERARLPEYEHRRWADVQDELAQQWYSPLETAEEMAWDNVREIVQSGWERAKQEAARSKRAASGRRTVG